MLEVLQDISQIMIWIMAFVLIGLILLQGGAGDVGSAFGGGGQVDGTLGVGANRKLAKLTGWLAFLFLAMLLILAMPSTRGFSDEGGALPPAEGREATAEGDEAATEPALETSAETPASQGADDAPATQGAGETPEEDPAAENETTEAAATSEAEGSGVQFGEVEDDAPPEEDPTAEDDAVDDQADDEATQP